MHLPHLNLETFRPRSLASPPDDAHGLVVLESGRVVALDHTARALGVVAGMRRAGVLSLAPDTQIRERDVARERELALGVAYAFLQFTPSVVDADEAVVLLDVTASLRLFHGIGALRQRVRDVVATFGVSAAISVASTGPAAWMVARGLRGGFAMSARSLQRALARVPLAVAPDARPHAVWFGELGCETLADLLRLPRAGLAKRCGTPLLAWLEQVTGTAPVGYEWLDVPPSFDTRVELTDRVDQAEALLIVSRRLILQMTGWLTARQLDVEAFALLLEHERGRNAIEPTEISIALGAPTRFEEHLTRLVRERLVNVELTAPVIAVRLVARRMHEAATPVESLFPEPGGTPHDHVRLLELLSARLGADNVLVPAAEADYRPEAAARWVPRHTAPKASPLPEDLPRPAWLLDRPVPLLMRGHRPFYGTPLRMVSPGERIEDGWQDDRTVTRDYFVAEDDNGICYWIFRERPTASDESETRFFLHGLFG